MTWKGMVRAVVLLSVLLATAGGALSATEPPAALVWLQVANDGFFNQDRGYTSGVELGVAPAGQPFSLRLGQDLYTPKSRNPSVPPAGQHPYAGWLYLAGDYRFELAPQLLLTSGLTLGTTGERALGEEAQDLAHQVLGFNEYDGWDSQISQRWGWIGQLRLDGRLPLWQGRCWQADVLLHLAGRGGNVQVDGAAGATLRLGLNPPPLQARLAPPDQPRRYLSLAAERRLVDRNVFLEGIRARDYHVRPERQFDTLSAGLHWQQGRYQLDLDFYFPEQEFKGQRFHCRYGILRLAYWF
ncbi:MAG: lipid A deacylase LpxR family protein [Desulfuromonas thiophila]|nr:lipid A deacylase LpxR family protein [Desulfuromonas thiophila]